MRLKFYAVALVSFMLCEQGDAASLQAEALAYLDILAEPDVMKAAEIESSIDSLAEADAVTEADLEAATSATIDLDCLGNLINECANGSNSACLELDKMDPPLPCIVAQSNSNSDDSPMANYQTDSENEMLAQKQNEPHNHFAQVRMILSKNPGEVPPKIIDAIPIKPCNRPPPHVEQKPASRPLQECDRRPPIGTGFQPDSDYIIKRHKVEVAPDRQSYETIDTTEVRRRIAMMPQPQQMFGPPPPLPIPLMRALSGLPPPCGPKPMITVIRRIAGDGPGRPGCPVRANGPLPIPHPAVLRKIIHDKITAKEPMPQPHPAVLRQIIHDKITAKEPMPKPHQAVLRKIAHPLSKIQEIIHAKNAANK